MKKIKINKVFTLTLTVMIIFSSTVVFAKYRHNQKASSFRAYECIDPFPMDGEGSK